MDIESFMANISMVYIFIQTMVRHITAQQETMISYTEVMLILVLLGTKINIYQDLFLILEWLSMAYNYSSNQFTQQMQP